ncbi:ELMO domain-containing protein A [Zostera marina]|uniref:ELMO domain-containing protein A n=1 Tax=Zostera marina TaxID=29655 RepID=A0A0K9P0Y8_ZOSMR|nr:ELMO domain-containing protein A [Zostera marina]
MSIQNLRRRVFHDDIDRGRSDDSINEPLLGDFTVGYSDRSQHDIWKDKKTETLHWSFIFNQLIAQWAHWLGSIIVGSGSRLGRMLSVAFQNGQSNKISPSYLSPILKERLRTLRQRMEISYDGNRLDHQNALIELWKLAYPDRIVPPLRSELWKDMGWQGCDPSTDFRGGGFISLENLIFFAKNYPESFQGLLLKQDGNRSDWEYPFAVAGVNISFMLTQMLDLQSDKQPSSSAGCHFLKLLEHDQMAFDNLYCMAFKMMDTQWLSKNATYMEFNDVLKSTRTQLESELSSDNLSCVKNMPSYNMLKQNSLELQW